MFVPTYKIDETTGEPIGEPVGVEMVDVPEGSNDVPQLKYPKPTVDLSAESVAKCITIEELAFLEDNMDDNTAEHQVVLDAIDLQME